MDLGAKSPPRDGRAAETKPLFQEFLSDFGKQLGLQQDVIAGIEMKLHEVHNTKGEERPSDERLPTSDLQQLFAQKLSELTVCNNRLEEIHKKLSRLF